MKKTVKMTERFISGLLLALMLLTCFNVKSFAASDYPYGFDFGDTVVTMDAGSTKEIYFWSRYDYTYYISEHTSKGTYCECSFKKGTEYIKLHIGKDETVKDLAFYFYIDEDPAKNGSNYAGIEVHVKNINTAFSDPAVVALQSYSGNNAAFNAYYYYLNYADLRNVIGINPDALLAHYNTFGITEGRVANKLL